MNRSVLLTLLVILVAGGGYWLLQQEKSPAPEPKAVLKSYGEMSFRELMPLARACEDERDGSDCTLIMEVLALKSQPQHARQGERFWLTQMYRLGDWYTWQATHPYPEAETDAAAFAKAVEVYEWVVQNKPFNAAGALYGKARLYDSKYSEEWAARHRERARELYEQVQERFPESEYSERAEEALSRL